MYTEKDCEMLIDLAKGLVVAQGTEESGREIIPFFMAAGKNVPREMAKSLPVELGAGDFVEDPTKKGCVTAFMLAGFPKSIWYPVMQATAREMEAFAVIFVAESFIGTFKDKADWESSLDKYKAEGLRGLPEELTKDVVLVYTKRKLEDGNYSEVCEIAEIDRVTKKIGKFETQSTLEGTGKLEEVKW